ncbi:MAG TPA: MBL fold metallo-hydrolase, partial [Prolixibacteraceae bacterium]|nr:MBL fold metallo-hydrolase [Prolixibacteraceae bacterium]
MKIEVFAFNPIQENTFVVYDENSGECAIIDPGCINNKEFEILKGFISANDLKPVKLVNTHCHFDHILGVERCRAEWNLAWEAHPADAFLVSNAQAQAAMFGVNIAPIQSAETALADGSEIKVGNAVLKVIHVPGHSPGSICLYENESQFLLAGDVLFKGSIGRTDLPQGD